MSPVSHNLNSSLVQTAAPDRVTGHSTTAPLDPLELGSPVPQSIFTTTASIRAWNAHLQKLDPGERNFFLKHAVGDVQSFSSLVERICTKHQKQSRISRVNNLLRPFCKTLGMLLSIASTASQADPYPSSLVIGGIMGLLQISDNFDSYQKLLLKWLSKLGAKATLLLEFDMCIYQSDEKVQEALVLIYGDILDFSRKALKLYVDEHDKRRHGSVVFGRSLIERFSDSFGGIVDNFNRHLDSYEAYAKLCDSNRLCQVYWMVGDSALRQHQDQREVMVSLTAGQIETRARQLQIYQAQVSAFQELRNGERQRGTIMDLMLAGRSEAQAQEDQRAAERKRAIEREEQARRETKKMRVMNWLPSVQTQFTQDERPAAVAASTGTWFRSHKIYESWKTSVRSDLLWVTGKPGCGKSVLAAMTWNELKLLQNSNTAVARFCCDSSNPGTSSYLPLMTTLLKQICGQSQRLHHDLEQMYDNEGLIQDRGPGVNEVEKLLPTITSDFTQAFIIIDGLDELQEPNAFLKFLLVLLRETTCQLRVIVFCRDYLLDNLSSQSTLKNYPHLHVDQGANKADIAMFISNKISEDSDWDPDLLEIVKMVLLERADGSFLYVSLMAGVLRGNLSQLELIDRLKSLPTGLAKAYEANLKRILSQEEESDKIMIEKILLWIANASRPLTRKELLEALSIRHGTNKKDRGGTDRDFMTLCAELVHFDKDNFYHLVHTSLRDYLREVRSSTVVELDNYRGLQLHAERNLAEACLTYLLYEEFKAGPVRTTEDLARILREHPFYRYAAKHWGSHVALAGEDAPANLMWEFIDNENARNLSMQVVMAEDDFYPLPGSSSPLHVLAYFGLSAFAETRSDLRELRHQKDGFGMLPMDYAMKEGKKAMCLWLLEKDESPESDSGPVTTRYSAYHIAIFFEWNDFLERLVSNRYDVNHKTPKERRTPLAEAAAQGNEWAVNRLLDAKADVNIKDAKGMNPLMIALSECHLNLVLPLLQNGTDIDAQDEDGMSALHFAVIIRSLETVRVLLERKAQFQVTSEKYSNKTPLHLAAERDHEEIFRALHEHGAELSSTCLGGLQPIHLAAFHDALKVARLLAELKAEINPRADAQTTVLHIAAEHSSVEFAALILTTDPELDAKDSEDENTALHIAATAGSTAVCKLLLDRGATVDLINAMKHTALHLAVSHGHTETARLLLDHGADAMKTAVFDSPVLHYAANEGNREILQPLLSAGADPEAANSHGHRALHFAARKGHKDFVENLFTAVPHLDPNSQDVDEETALHLAAGGGYLSTIQVLQKRGAHADIADSNKNLPSHNAARDGHLRVVETLVCEANVNAQGYNGYTMLNRGALRGHENIVLFLVDRNAKLELSADDGSTPLMNAVRKNHSEVAHLLITRGANVHTKYDDGRTLLHQAARNGDYDLAKMLIDRRCDAHAISDFGETLFHEAVASNNLRMVDLISNFVTDGTRDQTKIGVTPVHVAAGEGNLQMLAKLRNKGARIDSIDRIGRSALFCAANEGKHAFLEVLLSLGLEVDGHDNCHCTPLITVCEAGYVHCAEILLEHNANIHKYTRHNKMTALHYAAAMQRPQIVRKLVDLGADTVSRDCYANSALDYASSHPPSFQAIKADHVPYVLLSLADRRAILWRNIRNELESLLLLSQTSTVESEYARLLKLDVLVNSFLYLRDSNHYQTIKYLAMELIYPPKSALLQITFRCDLCNTFLNRIDLYTCLECHSVCLCKRCYEDYKEGWKGSNVTPEGIQELEQLEKQIEPLRQVMLSVIYEVKVEFIFPMLSFFPAVQTWVDAKRKEYDDWETEFNEDGVYELKTRPCQQLLKLLEEGRVFMKSLDETGLRFDEQRQDCTALVTKFSDYYRIFNFSKDNDEFHCASHQYLHVSKEEYDQASEQMVFQPNGRLADDWFRELLAKFPSVNNSNETQAESDENLRGTAMSPEAELQQPTERSVSDENSHDEGHTVETPPTRLPETSDNNAIVNDEIAPYPDKDPVVTTKPTEAPASSRPKMSKSVRSLNTPTLIPRTVSAVEVHNPIIHDNAVIEELRSPTSATTAFLNSNGPEDGAPLGRISNTRRFTAELTDRPYNLKRRITSPTLDAEEPLENSSLRRRATTPLSSILESQEQAIPLLSMDAQQPINREAPTEDDLTSHLDTRTLTEEPDILPPSQELAAETSHMKVISISSINNYGRFILLALTVAESILPEVRNEFIASRLERGDLAEFSLRLEIVEADR